VAGPADLQSYRTTFDALAQGRGRIWPDDAKGVFESYSSETDDLNRIWVLSDTDGDGQLTFAEFACAMHLLSQLSQGLRVPAALPPELLSSIQAAEATPAGPTGPAWGGWTVGAQELQKYRGAFEQLAMGRDRLGPDELGEVFGCSGLSADEMNQVWQMSDLDGDGQLIFLEFACAVHLLGLRRQGWPLPAEAPRELLGSLRS
jgi:Ca2+-binding EF-hand superfamily protein